MEHHQTVERPGNGILGWWTTVWRASGAIIGGGDRKSWDPRAPMICFGQFF